jgi:hypothetical protein
MKAKIKKFITNWLHQYIRMAEMEARVKSGYWM